MKEAVGVIGGVGSMAGAYYMRRVFEFTKVDKDQDHNNLLMYSHATIADRTAYILGKSNESPLPDLLSDAHILEALGCKFITIPCNTAQYFYDFLQENLSIPVVNIVKETTNFIKEHFPNHRKIGILATDGTLETGIYQKHLDNLGLETILPDKMTQKAIMTMIYEGVKKGKAINSNDFEYLLDKFRALGAEKIILGCTELSVVKIDLAYHQSDVIDALDVLAYETVRRANKPLIDNVFEIF